MQLVRASIDVGTHTARLLVARILGRGTGLRPLARKRTYIRLAEDFEPEVDKAIGPHALARTVAALRDFASEVESYHVDQVRAVATGLLREATNKDQFLRQVFEGTGIRVRPISGLEEGLLTYRGVIRAVVPPPGPFAVFDLGGGSTEFVCRMKGEPVVRSIPLGAGMLTRAFLKNDPPADAQLEALSRHIDRCLQGMRLNTGSAEWSLVGTGGTMTALAAILHRIPSPCICHDRINGLSLTLEGIEGLLQSLKGMTRKERLRLPGIDRGRADLILAGSLVVLGILRYFGVSRAVVSMYDLLEGILTVSFEVEDHG